MRLMRGIVQAVLLIMTLSMVFLCPAWAESVAPSVHWGAEGIGVGNYVATHTNSSKQLTAHP